MLWADADEPPAAIEGDPDQGRHYWHIKSKQGAKRNELLWGFWDVRARDDQTALIHTTFSRTGTNELVLEGFRWDRTDD